MIRCGQFMTAAQARRRCEQKEDHRQFERLKDYEDDELVRFIEHKEVRTGLVLSPTLPDGLEAEFRSTAPVVIHS